MYRTGRMRGSCSAGRTVQPGWGTSKGGKKPQETGDILERHAGAGDEQRGSVHWVALLERNNNKETEENCRVRSTHGRECVYALSAWANAQEALRWGQSKGWREMVPVRGRQAAAGRALHAAFAKWQPGGYAT